VGLRGEETSRHRQVDFDLARAGASVRTVAYVGSVDVKSTGPSVDSEAERAHPRRANSGVRAMRSTQTAAATGHPGKMKRKVYGNELRKLQVELCQLQDWVKATGARVIVVFEGRDVAGKGGTIKALTERVSPRVFRVMALPAPSDREKSQLSCSATSGNSRQRAK
jgi:polyphosphate kinase 2 (PPK2 family)